MPPARSSGLAWLCHALLVALCASAVKICAEPCNDSNICEGYEYLPPLAPDNCRSILLLGAARRPTPASMLHSDIVQALTAFRLSYLPPTESERPGPTTPRTAPASSRRCDTRRAPRNVSQIRWCVPLAPPWLSDWSGQPASNPFRSIAYLQLDTETP
jgi:hypothetical protein